MNTLPLIFRPSACRKAAGLFLHAALGLGLLSMAGCLGQETGIPQRHLHGVVTLPPVPLFEAEATPRSSVAEDNNDSLETSDGPFSIAHGYHRVVGTADIACAGISPDALETNCDGVSPVFTSDDADVDFFRIRSDYRGPIVFYAYADTGDADMTVYDSDGNALFTDDNSGTTEQLDDEGNPVLDEDGNPVLEIAAPRYSNQVERGDEFLVSVRVNADAEGPVGYSILIVGNDPNEHNQNFGIEGDTAAFETGSDEPILTDALDIKVGAYISDDIDELGNPVGGTSCKNWNLDEATDTFWCAWDMVFLQQVSVESDVIIEGMGDGKDNDCDGRADIGDSDADEDGDGFSVAEGDCNDTDPEVGPYRGDTYGDRKDNDCDGWADNGPDDVDDDGDGYCENGSDQNGDGFCRGPVEVNSSFGVGDCNDADPAIYPGLEIEVAVNGIDDDCTGGDAVLNTSTNSDNDFTLSGVSVHYWSDLEEEACGTNPFSDNEGDVPVDADGDGLCDSDCLGTVGCTQDNDGDGIHNWEEIQCNSDPDDAASLPQDFDGDEICDGKDDDADGDGFLRLTGSGGEDCHDLDTSIHPHGTDEVGVVTDWNYDVSNGIDDDCDGIIDENRDWELSGDEFVQNESYAAADEDGDGYSLGLRDCDDTDPTMHLGNYEVRSANVVTTDFNTVYLFAGDVTSLNSTMASANARRVTELVPYDLDKDRATWELADQWEEFDNPPLLTPSNTAVLEAWFSLQPEIGKIWYEAVDESGNEIPNDVEIAGFAVGESVPWADGHFQELGESAGAGKTNEVHGSISSIVADSWDGDNDAYHITFPEAGAISVYLDWDSPGGDYDTQWYCYFFNALNPPNYYGFPFEPGLTDLSKPEEGTTTYPLPDGADCWFFVVGYAGGAGGYTMQITPLGN